MSASVSTPRPPTTERVVALNRGPWLALPRRAGRARRPGRGDGARRPPVRTTTPPGTSRARSACPVDGGVVRDEGRVRARCPASGSCCTRASEATRRSTRRSKLWAVGILELAGYVLAPDAPETLATRRRRRVASSSSTARACRSSTCARRPSATAATSPARRTSRTDCCARSAAARSTAIEAGGDRLRERAAGGDRGVPAAARGLRRARGRGRRRRRLRRRRRVQALRGLGPPCPP